MSRMFAAVVATAALAASTSKVQEYAFESTDEHDPSSVGDPYMSTDEYPEIIAGEMMGDDVDGVAMEEQPDAVYDEVLGVWIPLSTLQAVVENTDSLEGIAAAAAAAAHPDDSLVEAHGIDKPVTVIEPVESFVVGREPIDAAEFDDEEVVVEAHQPPVTEGDTVIEIEAEAVTQPEELVAEQPEHGVVYPEEMAAGERLGVEFSPDVPSVESVETATEIHVEDPVVPVTGSESVDSASEVPVVDAVNSAHEVPMVESVLPYVQYVEESEAPNAPYVDAGSESVDAASEVPVVEAVNSAYEVPIVESVLPYVQYVGESEAPNAPHVDAVQNESVPEGVAVLAIDPPVAMPVPVVEGTMNVVEGHEVGASVVKEGPYSALKGEQRNLVDATGVDAMHNPSGIIGDVIGDFAKIGNAFFESGAAATGIFAGDMRSIDDRLNGPRGPNAIGGGMMMPGMGTGMGMGMGRMGMGMGSMGMGPMGMGMRRWLNEETPEAAGLSVEPEVAAAAPVASVAHEAVEVQRGDRSAASNEKSMTVPVAVVRGAGGDTAAEGAAEQEAAGLIGGTRGILGGAGGVISGALRMLSGVMGMIF